MIQDRKKARRAKATRTLTFYVIALALLIIANVYYSFLTPLSAVGVIVLFIILISTISGGTEIAFVSVYDALKLVEASEREASIQPGRIYDLLRSSYLAIRQYKVGETPLLRDFRELL